jgi:DNA repair exonuclease SbcCD nuclease subunit
MARIRLLHFSDLHVTNYSMRYKIFGDVYSPHILEEAARFAFMERDSFDGIIVTGDLVVYGANEGDLKLVHDFFCSPFSSTEWLNSRNKPTLMGCERPIIVLPGNHDRFSSLAADYPTYAFDRIFSSFWKEEFSSINIVLLPNPSEPILAIISADFSLSKADDAITYKGRYGQGRVYEDRLEVLAEKSRECKQSGIAVLWAIHFAPEFEKKVSIAEKHNDLIDAENLIKKARGEGISHIICGHTHLDWDYSSFTDSSIKIYCAGSSSCKSNKIDTTIHIRSIDIIGGKIVDIETEDLRWNDAAKKFLPSGKSESQVKKREREIRDAE